MLRVATLYVIVFWPIVQIIDIASPALGLPDTTIRYLLIAWTIGLPLALLLGWVANLKTGDADHEELTHSLASGKELGIVAVLMLLILGLFLVQWRYQPEIEQLTGLNTSQQTTPANTRPVSTGSLNLEKSIAVLPFTSFSTQREHGFFADGLTEELLNVLSKIDHLRVAARTSSFAYKDVNRRIQDIGAELGVATVLEGSVRQNDINNTIRVTAQLIDASTGTHLWSQTYDKNFEDIFRIQEDIAASVARSLELKLLGQASPDTLRTQSQNPEAMITFSMGQADLAKRTQSSMLDARRFFQRAIDSDKNYARAYVGYADANTLLVNYGHLDPSELAVSQLYIETALAVDNELGAAWASQGLVYLEQRKIPEARAALEKAMVLNPNYANAPLWYGSLLDDETERLEYYRRAYKLDPRSPIAGFNVANILINQGREAEAMDIFGRIVDADPFFPNAYQLAARIYEHRGRLSDAITQYQKVYDLNPNPVVASKLAERFIDLGNFEAADLWIHRLRQNNPQAITSDISLLLASRYAAAGDEASARLHLKNIIDSPKTTDQDWYLAIQAAYLVDDPQLVIRLWQESADHVDQMLSFQTVKTTNRSLDATVALIYAMKMVADSRFADSLTQVTNALDAKVAKGGHIDPELRFVKAVLAEISGDSRLALINLQRAVDEGWRQHWRPAFEPALTSLRNDKGFVSMMAGLENRMYLMREELKLDEAFAAQ